MKVKYYIVALRSYGRSGYDSYETDEFDEKNMIDIMDKGISFSQMGIGIKKGNFQTIIHPSQYEKIIIERREVN